MFGREGLEVPALPWRLDDGLNDEGTLPTRLMSDT